MPFEEEAELDGLRLVIRQHHLLPYGLVGFGSLFLALPLGVALGLPELLVPLVLGGPMLFVLGTVLRAKATLELHPTRLRVDAWTGWPFPWRRQVRLPLHGLKLRWSRGTSKVNGREVSGLMLQVDGGEAVHLPALRIDRSERAAIEARVDGMRELAALRQGAGEEEVPEALRGSLRATPERP